MLRLGKEKDELKVVNDQFGKPTYTKHLSLKTKEIIENKEKWGIYHLTNETKLGGITWYEFAKRIFEIAKIKVKVVPCTSKEFPRPAKRPCYSALINTKLKPLGNWREALEEYFLR